jgi:hypothetical protein
MRVKVRTAFLDNCEIHQVGEQTKLEYRIPAVKRFTLRQLENGPTRL